MTSSWPPPAHRGRRRRRTWLIGGAAFTGAATLAAAGLILWPSAQQPAAADPGLVAFDDCQAVDAWYTDELLPHVGAWGLQDHGGPISFAAREDGVTRAEAPAAADGAADSASQSSAVGVGGTGTNLQEAGVDEPDLAKTRDGLVYLVDKNDLVVLDVRGSAPVELGRVRIDGLSGVNPRPYDGLTVELLLVGDRVVVVATGYVDDPSAPTPEPYPTAEPFPAPEDSSGSTPASSAPASSGAVAPALAPAAATTVDVAVPAPSRVAPDVMPAPGAGPWGAVETTRTTVVDVSDPTDPTLVTAQEYEGHYVSARLTEGTVRVVTTSSPRLPFVSPSQYGDSRSENQAKDANRRAFEELTGSDFLPRAVERRGSEVTLTPRQDCAGVSHPQKWSGSGVITVRTLDVTAPDPVVDEDLVIADGDLVYASADRLYVGTTKTDWNGFTGDVVSSTELHGFDTTKTDATTYRASGQVPGRVLGRWALSENEGRLRVATTRDGGTSFTGKERTSQSYVTVLRENGTDLEQTGSVGGLGPGEQIYAVRWLDDTAYVVTFRQTDPLYVVDLTDPDQPRVAGELKIPGFSAYLHPVGGDHLLGIGQDAAEETGRAGLAQASLFDVTEPADPTRLAVWQDERSSDQYREYSRSTVADDSRQFSYLTDERLALVPLMSGGGRTSLVALRVGEDSLVETGRWQDRSGDLRRALSIGDGRVLVVSADSYAWTLTTMDATTLTPSGELQL